MEEAIENFDTETAAIDESELLSTIWLMPADTLRFILEKCPEKYIGVLFVLGGILRAINQASVRSMGDRLSSYTVLLIAVVMGAMFGWITYYFYAWAMSVTGKWLNGKAAPAKFRTVIAWSLIPSICALLLLVPQVIVFGEDLFRSIPENDSSTNNMMWIFFGVIEITLSIWSAVILIKGISIVQSFGIGKAILNSILPFLVLAIPFLLIFLIVS